MPPSCGLISLRLAPRALRPPARPAGPDALAEIIIWNGGGTHTLFHVCTQLGRGDTGLPTYARESTLYLLDDVTLSHCSDYRHHYALLYSHLRLGIINWPLFPTALQKLAAAPNRVSQDKTVRQTLFHCPCRGLESQVKLLNLSHFHDLWLFLKCSFFCSTKCEFSWGMAF